MIKDKLIKFDKELLRGNNFEVHNEMVDSCIETLRESYAFDDEVREAVDLKLEFLESICVSPDIKCCASIGWIEKGLKILLTSKFFEGYRVVGGEIVSVVDPQYEQEFINSVGHELNHLAATERKPIRRGLGVVGEVQRWGVGKTFCYPNKILDLNKYSQEGINTTITALSFGKKGSSYDDEVLATFCLPFLMGEEMLKTSTVLNPNQTKDFVNSLSGSCDWFGKMEILFCGLKGLIEKANENSANLNFDDFINKQRRIQKLIPKLAISDLLVPYFAKNAGNKEDVGGFIEKVKRTEFASEIDKLLKTGLLSDIQSFTKNGTVSFDLFKEYVESEFESCVSMLVDEVFDLSYNKLISTKKINRENNVFSQETSRKIIGICEYLKMNSEEKKQYEEDVLTLCEESEGLIKFKTGLALSLEHKELMDRIIPNKEGMKELGLFEYVAEKNGFVMSGIQTDSKHRSVYFSVSKNTTDNNYDQIFKILIDEAEKSCELT